MAFSYNSSTMSSANVSQQVHSGHVSGAIVIVALALLFLMYKGFASVSVGT